MNIKNLKPNKNAKTKQGYFNISESVKYKGNDKRVIYRSSWEKMFCTWCERNKDVEFWASESVEVKYLHPISNTVRNYYPDYLVKMKNGKILLVEVKPAREYKIVPKKPKRKTKKGMANYLRLIETIKINHSKFKSAISFCKTKNWTFFVADEEWFGLNKK